MNSSAAAILLLSATALAQDVISLRPVATGLDLPVAIAHANDSRLFITLQRGQIVIYDGTQILPARSSISDRWFSAAASADSSAWRFIRITRRTDSSSSTTPI